MIQNMLIYNILECSYADCMWIKLGNIEIKTEIIS